MEHFKPMNLQLFAEGEAADQTADNQSGEQEQKTGIGTEQKPEEQQEQKLADKPEEKTFKQEDVNNIVSKESKKATEKVLKELGIEDFKTARDGMKKFKEWQDSQKTEQEKQAESLKKLETDKNTLSTENQSLKAKLSALSQGVKPESAGDVVVLAEQLVNDDTTIDDAIKKVVEKYPQFAETQEKEEEKEDKKPSFSTGEHKKQPTSELNAWIEAFK